MMKAEQPAKAITKIHEDYYKVSCTCGDPGCEHYISVESDEFGTEINIYSELHTRWWDLNRWKQLWQLLTKGHIEVQSTIILDKQGALNYAALLQKVVSK